MQAHIIDRGHVGEHPEPGTPHTEPLTRRAQTATGRIHPRRLAHEQPAQLDQTCCAQSRQRALDGPRMTAEQRLQLIDPGAVLLGQPAQQLKVTHPQRLGAGAAPCARERRKDAEPPAAATPRLRESAHEPFAAAERSRRYQPSGRLTKRVRLAR
jgi:hypothetical protein